MAMAMRRIPMHIKEEPMEGFTGESLRSGFAPQNEKAQAGRPPGSGSLAPCFTWRQAAANHHDYDLTKTTSDGAVLMSSHRSVSGPDGCCRLGS